MGDASAPFTQAELLRKGGQYKDAAAIFQKLWSQEVSGRRCSVMAGSSSHRPELPHESCPSCGTTH